MNVCSPSDVKMQAGVQFGGSRKHVLAAVGMAKAANEMGREALCGGNWKRQEKEFKRRMKRAALAEVRAGMGLGTALLFRFLWMIVFNWFVDQYLGA